MTDAPVRADARRNRELVLRAAADVFAAEGLDVSLGRIARRAGVGAGTVYRHFPSKEFLLEAVLAEQVDGFTAAAERWAAQAGPAEALSGFLLEVIEKSAGRKLICDTLAGDRGWPHATLGAATQRFGRAQQRLLGNAIRAGVVRRDVRADDLAALIAGGAALRSAHPDRARGSRLVHALLASVVTKEPTFRDSTRDRGHETTACQECGAALQPRPTGRPPSYCGPTCRQRARRRRR
ncbi:TetR/AcrR family transcriptional regulator [Paractinoplanes lichenicola]|uniref:TetR/AcrR family transcriptional regulator n=1 Tax=Paractinoplanes lichenicola TaxID=2802976 RepID=A0ABS1VEM2_9ACTN|nr:TetR/AcrR family transcriptional regulator [Actinoplanes lichenicola]MBL7253136.1 TetR/AcrR family transcriptional regulator [Actinoplanes lichenicola]